MILRKLLNLVNYEYPTQIVANYDMRERYITHEYFHSDDMVVVSEIPISCERLEIYIDTETTDYEYVEVKKMVNASGDIIGYKYTRSEIAPDWVIE
jgi:hypothetical protein